MSKEDIIEEINRNLPFLKDKYHVKQLGVFGSVARDEQTDESDVDILVEFSSPIGFFDFIRLENFLEEKLKKKVDLVSKKGLKNTIRKEVLKETIYV
ncbi:MAG: polymerase beta domain protein region protein [Candidatus Moranbacteria bacterium GW2011_GWE1_35_17]|nr:MAG: polymerase beta domain protein region protein [Candidatus Moranbacteria bacterium GW2011_GWE1_35_17]KKP84713.1 MAG: polymerase beta domain protein region protein [Candidatus Moranbacteria bacterium GW2011_GWF2_35_54]HBR79310.1 DNA polymerase III subunit beta [Candidatus Moranbacteria bacterium]